MKLWVPKMKSNFRKTGREISGVKKAVVFIFCAAIFAILSVEGKTNLTMEAPYPEGAAGVGGGNESSGSG